MKDIAKDVSVVEYVSVSLRQVVPDVSKACEVFNKRRKAQLFFEMFGTTPATKKHGEPQNLSAYNTLNKFSAQIFKRRNNKLFSISYHSSVFNKGMFKILISTLYEPRHFKLLERYT